MDQATYIFDTWRSFDGGNEFFVAAGKFKSFEDYYLALLRHYLSPEMRNKSVIKKNLDMLQKISELPFDRQPADENSKFWSMMQVFFAQLRSKDDKWETPSSFANALSSFWREDHKDHQRFLYALQLDKAVSPVRPGARIDDRQIVEFEKPYAAAGPVDHELTVWFFQRHKCVLYCPVCGEAKNTIGTCGVCKSNPRSGVRLCPKCRRPLINSASFIDYGTKKVACRVCKHQLVGE